MTLAQDIFVKLSFHAKMHQLLSHNDEAELQARIREEINTTIEKIEKKELAGAKPELSELKQLALELRAEFDDMKKKRS